MNSAVRNAWLCLGLMIAVLVGGCPTTTTPLEFVAGTTGEPSLIRATASVTVLTPVSNLSIVGGTQVEVNWQAFATSRFAVIDVFFDVDQTPDNGNEIAAYTNLALTESKVLLDTTALTLGTYTIGVTVKEVGEIVTYGYAGGTVTIDQRPQLSFVTPRGNFTYDRASDVNPTVQVQWTLVDPDSTNTVEISLDPDNSPDGDEVPLFRSTSQTGENFAFQLPTASFAAGTYRILATVSDGRNITTFYAPGTIVLRARMAGVIDLRDLGLPSAPISGAIFEGFNPRDNAGSFVAAAGDLDGDGFGEIIVLSQFGKPQYQPNVQRTGIGEAYLIYGRQQRFSGVDNLNSTAVLYRGEVFTGVPEVGDPVRPTRGITSYTTLSDWDGDGTREMAFGLPFTDSDLATALAQDGLTSIAVADSFGAFRSGGVVIAAGGCLRPTLGYPGFHVFGLAAFGQLVRGSNNASQPCPEGFYGTNAYPGRYWKHTVLSGPTDLELNQPGCRIHTNAFGDQCGETISAYPFNGILISVPNRDPIINTNVGRSVPGAGVLSLYYGAYLWDLGNDWLPHHGPHRYILDDQALYASRVGFRQGSPGYWVDVDDSTSPCSAGFSLDTPIPSRTVRVYGGFPGAAIGNAVAVGDFSADGLEDFTVGSPLSNEGAGSCFLVLGRLPALVVSGELPVEELGLPMNSSVSAQQRIFDGIRVIGGRGDRLGQSQAEAGDFNGDGIADVIIGSPLVNDRRGGAAVFFGSRTVINLTQAEIPFDELASRGLGVIFQGVAPNDLTGARVASAGDIDGDGNDDVLIAAPNVSVRLDLDLDGVHEIDRAHNGAVYLVYGSADMGNKATPGNATGVFDLKYIGTEQLPGVMFIGRNSGDFLGAGLGEQGDRSHGVARAGDVDGDGRGDVLLGSVSASPRDRAHAGETYLIYGQ